MKRVRVSLFLTLILAPGAWGDVDLEHHPVHETIVPHEGAPGAAGSCSIVYYNFCSGWFWAWGWVVSGSEAGVVFDLLSDCGKVPGEPCDNLAFWWYWRHTRPGYDYTVSYNLYDVDSSLCLVGSPLGTLANQDPVERWNHYPGLGTASGDLVAITATLDVGSLPFLITDANTYNQNASCAPLPTEVHSLLYSGGETELCPPVAEFADELGPVNILMDATFSCLSTATEATTWGSVKSLFR